MKKGPDIPIVDVSDDDIAFGYTYGCSYMPKYDKIPDEYKESRSSDPKIAKFNKFVNTWFFEGVKDVKYTPKPDVDEKKVIRMVSSIMRSWTPKHEHKEAACTYIMCYFFDDVEYDSDHTLTNQLKEYMEEAIEKNKKGKELK